jgi:hypothetical protein
MRIGAIQSCYIPWRGYFDFIDSVDLFVLYDDVQYSSGSWRNRNQVKAKSGLRWITVPVRYRFGDPIDAVAIGQTTSVPWQEAHRRLIGDALASAPYFAPAIEIWREGVSAGDRLLSELNLRLIRTICQYLQIPTPIVLSRDFGAKGSKTDRLLDLCGKVGATTYLSGPTARGYIDEERFRETGVGLEYKSYDYPPYPQQWGQFTPTVTVLDLIANCGPRSREFLKSRTPNEAVVPV